MSVNRKIIITNTLFLYARMFFILLCNLYLVRIVLDGLGVEDYGINNVVGGVVIMFTFLTSTMNAASQRFFSFKIGENDINGLKNYFTVSFWGYLITAGIVIFFAETLGLWFLQTKLTIPLNRMNAAFWIYQGSVITFVCNLLAIPYTAILIAREKMKIYAYVGILEVLLRITVAYSLFLFTGDKLKIYAILQCIAMCIPSIFYIIWGLIKFSETRIQKIWDKEIFKEIFIFSGWNLFGAISSIIRSQGINILLNMFFGPTINAARAIAYQINSAINQFVLNFFKAVQPQITKCYASNERKQMLKLVYASSKFCYFLILLIALPLFIEAPFVLSIWLKEVPENAVLFSRLVIITAVIESTMYPLQTALMATGDIKWYQITTALFMVLNLPISYFLLKNGFPAESVLILISILALFSQTSRLVFMKLKLQMSLLRYTQKVLIPIILVSVFSFSTIFALHHSFKNTLINFFVSFSLSAFSVLFFSILFGLEKEEKDIFFNFFSKLKSKIHL